MRRAQKFQFSRGVSEFLRVVSQGKKQRNFNVLAKDKIDEKPLQDFSMANAAKNVSRSKVLMVEGY